VKSESVKSKTGLELKAQAAALRRPPAAQPKTRAEQLADYRQIVVEGQRNFVTVGTALGLIAKERLFKDAGFKSFEDMVAAEFDMATSTAYRLVDAARVVTILSQVGTIESKIKNQSQALALAPLVKDREAMVLVIAAAEARAARLTADLLTEVRVELYPHTEVIDGEVVPEKSALVRGVRKAIEQAAEKTAEPGPEPMPVEVYRCEKCNLGLPGGIVKAAQRRCLGCDPNREHFAREVGGPCVECNPETPAAVPAGSTEDASPALGEPDVDDEVALTSGTQTAAAEGGLLSPAADGVEAVTAFLADDAPAPDGGGAGPARLLPSGVTPEERTEEEAVEPPVDTPAADHEPHSPQQPGQDSPIGRDHLAEEPSPDGPAVATADRSETDHHQVAGVSSGGETAPAPGDAVEPVLEDGGSLPPELPSSSDPTWMPDTWSGANGDDVLYLFNLIEEAMDRVEPDVVGPVLTVEEIASLHKVADRVAQIASLVEHWQRTP